MVATKHTQSLTDFRQNATETLERLNRTGEAEVLTVNGEARAVMLSPAAFDEMAREVEQIRFNESVDRAREQLERGEWVSAEQAFERIEKKLKALRTSKGKGKTR